jgi:hypothetical protein
VGFERTALVAVCTAFIVGLFCWYVLNRHGWGMMVSVGLSLLAVWLYRRSRGGEYGGSRPVQYRGSRPVQYRGSRPAEYRGSRPAEYRGSRPAQHRGSRSPQYRDRGQGTRRPPY